MSTAAEKPDVTLYWRPGCGFCHLLRRELDRAGIVRTEVNIWEDPEAAALVRTVAWGNETVPTVVVGDRAMVNPSAREVLAAMGTPDEPVLAPARVPGSLKALSGAGWSITAAAVWMLLALSHPTTTYHFAPLVIALAWPLAVSRNPSRGRRRRHRFVAVIGGGLLGGATLAILAGAHVLAGPTLIGSNANDESLIMLTAGALIGWALAVLPRSVSGPTPGSESCACGHVGHGQCGDQRNDAAAATTCSTGG